MRKGQAHSHTSKQTGRPATRRLSDSSQGGPAEQERHAASELQPKVQSPEGMGYGGIREANRFREENPQGKAGEENAAGS